MCCVCGGRDPFQPATPPIFWKLGILPTLNINPLKNRNMEKVLDYTGAKGYLDFLDTNIGGTARIMVSLVNEKGEVRETFCSTTVSAELRSGKRTKDSLMFLNVALNENGRWIIQREKGNVIRVAVASLNLKEAPQTVATFEDAIGY